MTPQLHRPLTDRESLHRWRLIHRWINRQLQNPHLTLDDVSLEEARILLRLSYPDAPKDEETGPTP